jgi:ATPases involved in chromosome partitioning
MYWGDKKVIAVGGGKGGIGKSAFVANLGVTLASQGKRVTVVDADIGAANLHTIIGVQYPAKTLDDFLANREPDIEHTLVETPYPPLRLLSSASDVLGLASPNYKDRQRLYRAIKKLRTDIIIFDIAAGTHQRATDFFTLAPIGIIIIEPIPTSLENAFSFIKNMLVRGLMRTFHHNKEMTDFIEKTVDPRSAESTLHFADLLVKLGETTPGTVEAFRQIFLQSIKMHVVANAIRDQSQKQVAEKFSRIIKRYLALDIEFTGTLPYEQNMDLAISGRVPFVVKYPQSGYAKNMQEIIVKLGL